MTNWYIMTSVHAQHKQKRVYLFTFLDIKASALQLEILMLH